MESTYSREHIAKTDYSVFNGGKCYGGKQMQHKGRDKMRNGPIHIGVGRIFQNNGETSKAEVLEQEFAWQAQGSWCD